MPSPPGCRWPSRLARRYQHRGEPFDDLVQAAAVGLIKAVDGYDPAHGSEFAAYAIPTVLGEVKRHFRDRTWSLRIPRRLQELRLAINAAQTHLNSTLQRSPTVADLAGHLGVSEEDVIEALEAGRAYRAVSLATPVDAAGELTLADTLGGVDAGYAMAEFGADLPQALATLSERERQIIMLRFFGNQTQTVIAEQLGISQMHVSRLLTGALAKLRKRLT